MRVAPAGWASRIRWTWVATGEAFAVTHGLLCPKILLSGLCGALTTYSTFGYETLRLLQERARFCAALNAVASGVAGPGAAFCGIAAAQAIWP